MKAVETGQVNVVVMNGAQPALTVNAGEATSSPVHNDWLHGLGKITKRL